MSGEAYIGSKISLVSKSEIRYEGILYSIDTKVSTIALAKVKTFGTEGRVVDRHVSPRDEIYDFIIFRTNDIKELHVCEPPKAYPVSSSGLPNDPAILQHSAPVSSCNIQYGQTFGPICGVPSFPNLQTPLATYSNVPQSLLTNHPTGSRSGASQTYQKKSTTDASVQVSSESLERIEGKDLKSRSKEFRKPNFVENVPGRANNRLRGFFPNRRFQRGRGARRGRGRGRTNSISRNTEILKFDSEYDFELANAEFIELENKLGKGETEDALVGGDEDLAGYDKKKSFFDNISCEASRIDKGIPRFDWNVEKKLNVETFGVPVSANWLRRRRGRGGFRRGGKGRGTTTSIKVGDEVPKAVTFGEKLVTAEIERPDTPIEASKVEDIPIIELVAPKEAWEESSEANKEQWK